MSTHYTARRLCALALAAAGVLGATATTAAADSHSRHQRQSRVVISDVDLYRNHGRHHHQQGGTVELTNRGRAGENLRGWRLCDDDRHCMRLSGYLRAHDDDRFSVRFLDRNDRIFLVNDHNRIVDTARVHR